MNTLIHSATEPTNYALVRDGKVVNLAVFDKDGPPADWPDRKAWTLATPDMVLGAELVAGRWMPPPGPVAEIDPLPPAAPDTIDAIRADLVALMERLARLEKKDETANAASMILPPPTRSDR